MKHIRTDGYGNATEQYKAPKAKPKPYTEPGWLRDYRLNRERYFWNKYSEQRAEIEEMVKEMKKQWETQDKRKEQE